AVIELEPLTTTVTLAGRSGTESWIEACEFEPGVGSADLGEERGLDAVLGVVDRLLGGRKPTYFVVLGISDPTMVVSMRSALSDRYGAGTDLRPISGADLLRGGPASVAPAVPPPAPPEPAAGSLQQHMVAGRTAPRRRALLFAGTAGLVAVTVIAAVLAVILTRPMTTAGTAAATSMPAALGPAETFGRVTAAVPAGWHIGRRSDTRTDFSPDNGARERLSLVQKSLTAGIDSARVASTLETQIAQRPPGTVGPLHRDVMFGGRPGLSYAEYPGDGTTVRWQVLVESGVQISVGCQYVNSDWPAISGVCEAFTAHVRAAS
ncbi:MAG: type VII secretion-associated protein, partial [Nocardia sp.]|nr:type VII secretion-associated protein [Nocardia sp.]